MNKEEYLSTAEDIIYLLSCSVNNIDADKDRCGKMNTGHLFELSEKHMLSSAVAATLIKADIFDNRFLQAEGAAMRRTAIMEEDKNKLFSRLNDEKIRYMPLKGSVLKNMYPLSEMREMSDIDILFDCKYQSKVRDIMKELGFSVEHYGIHNHDVYFKKPVSYFEMHTALFSKITDFYDYYTDIFDRLIRVSEDTYEYCFSPEDFYIYIIAHGYKHYYKGGTGLRTLLDIYVILNKTEKDMDFGYITRETEKLGICEYEKKIRRLSCDLFSGKELDNEEREMFEYIVFSGTSGNFANEVENSLKKFGEGKKAKRKYILRRIFPTMKTIENLYPFFYRHKILLPALYVYRIGKAVSVSREKIAYELKVLKNKK